MQIEKTNHDSGLGIYAPSVEVTDWKAAKEVSREMEVWMDETNGSFKGEHPKAFAMAHCQVVEHDHPLKLFVLDKELVAPKGLDPKGKQNLTNVFFEAQSIFNAEILEAPVKILKAVPTREVGKQKDGKVDVTIKMVEKSISNIIDVPEGCMSFGHRKAKNVKRCYGVRVRYQYVKKGLLGDRVKTFEGWVEGLKAHILQHETDHFNTKNIYFQS